MALSAKPDLDARKQPRQARSQATVDAIFEAAIQVLLREGPNKLTTIRVAERAGASVGTLYQYFPNKQALLYAIVQRHLDRIMAQLEQAAEVAHGQPLAVMVSAVVEAFLQAKMAHFEQTRALYAVAGELDTQALIQAAEQRGRRALQAMLATAADANFEDLEAVAYMFSATMIGPTRFVLENPAPAQIAQELPQRLTAICLACLQREARQDAADSAKTPQ